MTNLHFEDFKIKGHRVGKASWFPAIRELIKSEISAELDEDDGLFIGYGMMSDGLPYTLQDDYDYPEEKLTFKAAILENKYLKAVFLPELGGRLWALYDKENKRDLILENTRFIPCNLAIRNAWFAGGVEFNCGRRGHDEQTVSPRYAAVVETEDFPVLRIYEYQRDRGTPFQYDCFLPENSRFLYIRCRIYNPNDYVVPMYWWSNIATAEVKGSRIVVPAKDTFANWYTNGSHALAKLSLPDGEGFDGTYPTNFQYVKDHFYNIPEDHRAMNVNLCLTVTVSAMFLPVVCADVSFLFGGKVRADATGIKNFSDRDLIIILNFRAGSDARSRNVCRCRRRPLGNGSKATAI